MQLDGDNQFGDFGARDIATTIYRVAVAVSDNGVLLSEIVRRLGRLEHGAVVRHHLIVANAIATLGIVAVMVRSYRRSLRGALARRKSSGT